MDSRCAGGADGVGERTGAGAPDRDRMVAAGVERDTRFAVGPMSSEVLLGGRLRLAIFRPEQSGSLPMGDLRMVIFDCDGVLVDSEPISNRVLAEALTAEGLPTTLEEALAEYK